MKHGFAAICCTIMILFATAAKAQDSITRAGIHFQTTYVYQYKPSFHAAYSGANSLSPHHERQNSITATLYLGARLWKGASIYVNPEIAGGSGLSGALGMAGSSNGETFRVGDPAPALYLARAYLQQVFALSQEREWNKDDANDLGGFAPKRSLTIYAGKFSLGDLFDNNEYSNSPRQQFLNWSLMNTGAWDYAANVRGYTYSLSADLDLGQMHYKLGLAALPKEANGADLNTDFSDTISLAVNLELDRAYSWKGKKGNLRLLGFLNQAPMGHYRLAAQQPVPDITTTRRKGRRKHGLALNWDQQTGRYTGLFARLGWNDGRNESWAFTEIDRTATAGLSFNGAAWKREDDVAGVALAVNGLSRAHRNYLAQGGYGFIIGDGALRYSAEAIAEAYYSFKPAQIPLWLTGDYQFVLHPAYNRDRGPASIFSLRLHTEF